ncbi:hypothetical protein Kisp01_07290 [Kineosporia sp. NBRC 101677]|uniref:DUF7010 family protein n=1 Tax=Kineosporia sp. NBRC 101677 TaxID=3032197 RepID=UPI0024A5F9DD|nr:hypothetical protein [Kineosporia sp. NBRC 101677]GLY13713.1 hypothetical protein Kisp01_07290 [Kineosporia sp. NBRC 101677]
MDVGSHLDALARATGHGWAFLAAYGATWLLCAWVWTRANPRTAALATLFQGMVALPAALVLTAAGPDRPDHPVLDDLSVVLATGQLLGLPIVVYLVLSRRYELVPLAMALLLVVHFAPYSWLYRTPLYFVLGTAVALTSVTLMARAERADGPGAQAGAAAVCAGTGVLMAAGAVLALTLA